MDIGLNAGLGRNATLNDLLAQIEKAEADGIPSARARTYQFLANLAKKGVS